MTEAHAERELAVEAGELRVVWDLEALRAGGEAQRAWRAHPEPAPAGVARVLTGRFEDGRLLLVAAMRPPGSRDHGREQVAGALVSSDDVERFEQVLLSTEYDGAGATTRLGLEGFGDGEIPRRAAADVRAREEEGLDGRRVERVLLELRSGGVRGSATLETISRA